MSSDKPKWKARTDLTYEQLFNPNWFNTHIGIVWIARELEEEYGKEKAHEIINNATKRRPEFTTTKNTPEEIVKEWREWMEPTSPLMSHVVECEFEEVSPLEFRQCVSYCLLANAFKGMDAGDIGYIWECNTDYESARRFHPNLKMKRTKTIMQGDDYCDLSYYWEEKESDENP